MSKSIDRPPRLKSLELQGYKTFAIKTPFAFATAITAVVGPNGSGKSNIADSIRWVLGEQAYSLLRGKRTEDMIFSGSESRSRASMASATITFDNSDGWLPIDFTEVTISRRAYRDGQNEYYLNGERVRLRDVTELLASCGLAQRTYTIIGQGLVDAALSLKAEERRRLFEEAAGIGLYRTRREEALRRLANTRRNLERAQDILAELRPRLRSLQRQAKRAGVYEQVKEDLKAGLEIWYGYHWYHLLHKVNEARARDEHKARIRTELRDQQETAERELSTTRRRIDVLRSQLHKLSQQVTTLYGEREVSGTKLAVAQERLRWLLEQEELMQSEIASLEQTRSGVVERLIGVREDSQRTRQELADAEAARHELVQMGEIDSSQREKLLIRAKEARKALEGLVAEQATWEARQMQLEERLVSLDNRRAEIQLSVEEAAANLTSAREEAHAAEKSMDAGMLVRQEVERDETTLRAELVRLEQARLQEASRLSDLGAQHAGIEARLQVLRARPDEIERTINRLTDARLRGLVGRFGEHIQISPEHQKAITAVLGEFGESLAFHTIDDILATLEWMESAGMSERAALLPIRPPRINPLLEPPLDPGCVGVASRLVRVSAEYQSAVELLLGRTLVVKNREAALRLLTVLPLDARIVTLAGDVYYPTGQVLLGGGDQEQAGRDTRRKAEKSLEEVSKSLKTAELEAARLSGEVEATKHKLAMMQQALRSAVEDEQDARLRCEQTEQGIQTVVHQQELILAQQRSLEEEIAQFEEEQKHLLSQSEIFKANRPQHEQELREEIVIAERAEPSLEIARVEARLEVARRATDEVDIRITDLEERLRALEGDLKQWTDRLEANRAEQERKRSEVTEGEKGMEDIEKRLAAVSAQIVPAEEELAEVESALSATEAEESQTRVVLRTSEREHSQAQIKLARREEELVSLKRRIEDDFGLVTFDPDSDTPGQEPLPLEGFVKRLQKVDELPLEFEIQVNRLRAQLRRVGAVNPEAQREFHEVKERTDFLTAQVDDLRQAESQIQEVIAELDLLMEREFRITYEKVAVAFREVFTRLFGGGSARLVLTDPDDMTQTGIDIEARLPGRREQGLAVLSGGERSLTACALIFALLKVSPTPFCVLDEVDAMLDDANVIRYIEMLRELSHETQFILITHNRLTVQAAEMVYGVSMEADSISRVISLKLDEVEEAIAA